MEKFSLGGIINIFKRWILSLKNLILHFVFCHQKITHMYKGFFRTMVLSVTIFITASCKAQNSDAKMDSVSYSVGVLMAQSLKQQNFENLNPEVIAQAISDVLKGKEPKYSVEECNKMVQDYMQKSQTSKYQANISEGEKFLAENAKKPGVTTTASGLQYEVLKPGAGAKPTPSNQVTVHYVGTLLNGKEFDSSVRRGEPATFGVTQVIQGWVEGLQLMPLGSKYKFYIPADLGYGERGAGADIPPFSTLIFEVELIKIL
jgi:FKBP-type peptidyl-prolyl cis-trans isomerase FklB